MLWSRVFAKFDPRTALPRSVILSSFPLLSFNPFGFILLRTFLRDGRHISALFSTTSALFLSPRGVSGGYPSKTLQHLAYPPFPIPYLLSFHTLAHSSAHFCTQQKPNSFVFKRFCTLR